MRGNPNIKTIGLFADTDNGLVELKSIGGWTHNSYNYEVPSVDNMPSAKNIRTLYVNIPDVKISSCDVFFVPMEDVNEYRNSKRYLDLRRYKPLSTTTEVVKSAQYKVSSPAFVDLREGCVLFLAGGSGKMYFLSLQT